MKLKSSVAVVTGGAQGIGAACARAFRKAGCQVALWDIDQELGNKLAKELGGIRGRCIYIYCDATSPEEVEKALKLTLDKFKEIHILVNCAGVTHQELTVTPNATHDLDNFRRVLRVNLHGLFYVTRLIAFQMSQQQEYGTYGEKGVILNLSNVAGIEGQRGQLAFSASSGGVIGLTLPMARDLARFKIRVLAIAVGVINTSAWEFTSEKRLQNLRGQTPLGRIGEPDEVAHFISALVENEFLTGDVYRIDGGLRLPNL